jgi:Na+/serine symporter
MENIRRAYEQYFYYILAAGVVIGFILGLIPLYLGVKRGRKGFGIAALIVSTAAGAVSPILVVLLVAVFSFLITRGTPDAETDADSESVEEVPASEEENQ